MRRFARVLFVLIMLVGSLSTAHATDLKVKGNLDVHGMWSANLKDFDSDYKDGDNYFTSQRMRTYFSFVASENLKAVLGLEMDIDWGKGDSGDWGTDGNEDNPIEVKHAYLDFNFPDSTVNAKAGLQAIALPSVFGNPVFDDDAAALVLSAPINDMFAITVGYSRGSDASTNIDDDILTDGDNSDDLDMAFAVLPVTVDGFALTPYFAFAWLGEEYDFTGQQGLDTKLDISQIGDDSATVWVAGTNAKLTMFDPLTVAADLIYGSLDSDNFESQGWYAALAATYKFEMLTATVFSTYGTGLDDDDDDQSQLPTLAEDWKLTPNLGGVRAFSTSYDTFATKSLGVGSDGTGLWTLGLILDKISFVDKLSHKLTLAYVEGTGDEDTSYFTEKDSGWEAYLVNEYKIYENLSAINELCYFSATSEGYEDANPDGNDLDASYFATVGFSYKF